MHLAAPDRILKIWKYAIEQGASVVLMRHAPKAGSDDSGLSEYGRQLAIKYGSILRFAPLINNNLALACTSKDRTLHTLKYMFPFSYEKDYLMPSYLEVNKVSFSVQSQVNDLHQKIGRFRGHYLNHTYYFLEKLGGEFDEESIHTVIAKRMAEGIRYLFDYEKPILYCGHSPAIEVGLEKLLGLSLSELGGFLNPLDSIHLRMKENEIEWVARINPIVDYVDLESETYF